MTDASLPLRRARSRSNGNRGSDITAVGFVPAAPLLVPQVAGGSAGLDAELREACREVARHLTSAAGETITVVAPLAPDTTWSEGATWGFEGFGVPRQPADSRPRLPWPLGVGDWLLDEVEWTGKRQYAGIAPDASAHPADAVATEALLVVGDGTARRTEKAPGHFDDRAEAFDATIAAALRAGDRRSLAGLDPVLAADLLCAGAPVWRWVAAALGDGAVVEAELLAEAAPYGVAYFAGFWRLSR